MTSVPGPFGASCLGCAGPLPGFIIASSRASVPSRRLSWTVLRSALRTARLSSSCPVSAGAPRREPGHPTHSPAGLLHQAFPRHPPAGLLRQVGSPIHPPAEVPRQVGSPCPVSSVSSSVASASNRFLHGTCGRTYAGSIATCPIKLFKSSHVWSESPFSETEYVPFP